MHALNRPSAGGLRAGKQIHYIVQQFRGHFGSSHLAQQITLEPVRVCSARATSSRYRPRVSSWIADIIIIFINFEQSTYTQTTPPGCAHSG